MSEDTPVNLNKVRKARKKAQARRDADENAVRFGRTKAQKAREAAEQALARTRLDAHRIERDTD
ncbi:MAG: DUF4169 family protein [Shimia sp.]